MSLKFTTSVAGGAAKLCIQGLFFKVQHNKSLKAHQASMSVLISVISSKESQTH